MLNRSDVPVITENHALPEGFPMMIVNYTQVYNPKLELHVHNCLEIGRVCSGSGVQLIEGKVYPFTSNSVTIIQKGCIHDAHITLLSPDETPSQWKYLFVNLDFFGIPNTLEKSFLVNDACICQLFDLLVSLYETRPVQWQEEVVNILRVVIMELHRASISDRALKKNIYSDSITVALHIIARDYASDLTVDALAKECNMSISYFRKTFTEIVGISPLKYIISVRLNMAEFLIKTTNKQMVDISSEVGFRTLSSFNRLFKKNYGYAPRSLRA